MQIAEVCEKHHISRAPRLRIAAFLLSVSIPLLAAASAVRLPDPAPELEALLGAYPDVAFDVGFDPTVGDWRIRIASYGKISVLYRAEGRYLPLEKLDSKERFRVLVYKFPEKLADPADFTPEQTERFFRFGSTENRRTAPVSDSSFFDAVYDCATQEAAERHIAAVSFLGRPVRVHERITGPLARAEEKIRALARTDPAVREFIGALGTVDGYFWRRIRDTSGRSFHSMGLALDLLPVGWQKKIVYWNWEKNKGNERWMLIPLSKRWMPPEAVILVLESEGFIWGGKWPVWDNMHFEYRPELLAGRPRQPGAAG